MAKQKRVAVIGAGMCGLAAAKECVEAGGDIGEVVVFELSDSIGGVWRFTEEESLSSVYRSTCINTTRDQNVIPQVSADFAPLMMHHTDMQTYFSLFADKFDLRPLIRFSTRVVSLTTKEKTAQGKWTWELTSESGGERKTEVFDSVIISSGHHSAPSVPKFPGMDEFPGLVVHSHVYKDNRRFEGLDVVVVGIGNSGSDIVTEISKVAKSTHLVARRGVWAIPNPLADPDADMISRFDQNLMGRLTQSTQNALVALDKKPYFEKLQRAGLEPSFGFSEAHPTMTGNSPENNLFDQLDKGLIVGKKGIARFDGSTVHFADGSSTHADAVVLCTGYQIGYPFLDEKVLTVKDNTIDLYQYCFSLDPAMSDLCWIGLCQPIGSMVMMADVMARAIAQHLAGKLVLPSPEEMRAHTAARKRFNREWYYDSPRHTIQVSPRPYLDEVGEMLGCTPTLWRVLSQRPSLLWTVYAAPTCAAHYRLFGVGACPDEAVASMTKEYKKVYARVRNRRTWIGFLAYYAKMFGVVFPIALLTQLKSVITTGKPFFYSWA